VLFSYNLGAGARDNKFSAPYPKIHFRVAQTIGFKAVLYQLALNADGESGCGPLYWLDAKKYRTDRGVAKNLGAAGDAG